MQMHMYIRHRTTASTAAALYLCACFMLRTPCYCNPTMPNTVRQETSTQKNSAIEPLKRKVVFIAIMHQKSSKQMSVHHVVCMLLRQCARSPLIAATDSATLVLCL
jgi:hypothetical protein